MVKPVASKFLAQKWETEQFRVHRMRVKNAPSLLDMASPKQFPHLKLGVNKIAIQEEKQNKYDKENQMLLNKIRVIVKGHGTLNNWNRWARKDLHAAARFKQQQEIELANQAMLKRLKNTKPVIQRKKQEEAFKKHKEFKEIMESGIKDYNSPRTTTNTKMTMRDDSGTPEEKSEPSETSEKKGKKQPSENSKKNRTADVPKLPAI